MRSPHPFGRIATILSTLVIAAAIGAPSSAQARSGGPFGLGAEIGDPSGLSFKYFLGGNNALDGTVGFNLGKNVDWLQVNLDYLFHFPQRWGGGEWLPYVGIGGKLRAWDDHHDYRGDWYDDDDDFAFGVRIPLGLAWHPGRAPIDIFAEIVPGLWVLPGTNFDFDFALGVRFFF